MIKKKRHSNGISLTQRVATELREAILSGKFLPGDKLPTEPVLVADFGVSRTVIRESIAALRADGLVDSRHGVGVFVREPSIEPPRGLPPRAISKISDMLEELELRNAVEMEAAALAAERRSPAQAAKLMEKMHDFDVLSQNGEATSEADFEFHLAIARATNNDRFELFLRELGRHTIPRENLKASLQDTGPLPNRDASLSREHRRIAEAVSLRDPEAARAAMREHLDGSAERYRLLLK
jgi:GntR family transcriptional regulator, transcriptional repressor for pyruvate dehydrogenase complex